MPPRLIHCQSCGALLNSDLQPKAIELPEFVPLREVVSMMEVRPIGFYVGCPRCERELRIHAKYTGQRVQCKFCRKPFEFQPGKDGADTIAFYTDCPHCRKEIRAARKYMGARVACKLCDGAIHFSP
jgi:uncharacterized protein (DUF983 family)